ncbi:hypothetical protein NE237_023527 [Protea cynaroides]|uniref:Uncharacterized protein n=1 Tax=Protea cynaroides TaxID=273540 RepID=A0A9Q0K6N7_9MAGN|nr:hypothetical protein NE237_023527 [Protea cynaroides]
MSVSEGDSVVVLGEKPRSSSFEGTFTSSSSGSTKSWTSIDDSKSCRPGKEPVVQSNSNMEAAKGEDEEVDVVRTSLELKVTEEQLQALREKKMQDLDKKKKEAEACSRKERDKDSREKRGKGGVEASTANIDPSKDRQQKLLKKKHKESSEQLSEKSSEVARDNVLADVGQAYAQPLIPNPRTTDFTGLRLDHTMSPRTDIDYAFHPDWAILENDTALGDPWVALEFLAHGRLNRDRAMLRQMTGPAFIISFDTLSIMISNYEQKAMERYILMSDMIKEADEERNLAIKEKEAKEVETGAVAAQKYADEITLRVVNWAGCQALEQLDMSSDEEDEDDEVILQ